MKHRSFHSDSTAQENEYFKRIKNTKATKNVSSQKDFLKFGIY